MFPKSSVVKRDNTWLYLVEILVLVIVVVRHASMPDWFDRGYPAFDAFGKGIIWATEICLPAFFILAGYLFFRGVPKRPEPAWFGKKYLCGLKVLVIPYLIANLLSWFVYAAAYKFAPSLMSGFLEGSWTDPLFIFWKGPINMSLWFMREVIVAFLVFPLIYLLVRYTWGIAVVALGVLWGFHLAPEPLFWFALGSSLAILPLHSRRLGDWMGRHPLRIGADCLNGCYFIYLYHYLPQIAMKKVGIMLLPGINSAGLIAVWICNALILLAGLFAIYLLLRRFAPKLLALLVGSW